MSKASGGNAFESGARRVIPAVLIYVRRGDRVLMLHRNSGKPDDYHSGKWNGLGGKLEADESPLEAAQRELREESGLDLPLERFRSLGTLQFPNFKSHQAEDWLVFLFGAELPGDDPREPVRSGPEGDLHWVPVADLLSLNLWPGDQHFLPHVLEREPISGTIWYDGPKVTRVWIERLLSGRQS